MNRDEIKHEAVELLKKLIATPSYSGQEDETANLIFDALRKLNFHPHRKINNVWAVAGEIEEAKPTILFNSHHDTVKAGSSWTYDPFKATIEGDKLTGLGSNDAGGPLVSLFGAFLHLSGMQRDYNLIFAATGEEENSGMNGIRTILDELGRIDLAIVGEPTQMQMAVAEKGLVVLDCVSHGKTGHAARNEGENALYKAMKDIEWFRTYEFPKKSEVLGSVHMCVTQIEAGSQHNVVPDRCSFVVDVRTTDAYSNEEAVAHIKKHVDC
jgi:acetylornithine deacetylase